MEIILASNQHRHSRKIAYGSGKEQPNINYINNVAFLATITNVALLVMLWAYRHRKKRERRKVRST